MKTTENTLKHVKEIIQQFGRPLECITDRGPSYRGTFEDSLEALGVRCHHGASYNPTSQAMALAKNRAKLARKFKNSSDASFQLGQKVLVWNRKEKKYSDDGVVVDMEESDDGLHRSFIVNMQGGQEVHLHSNHLIPAPMEEGEGQDDEVGAV